MDRSDREKKAAEFIRTNLKSFRSRKPPVDRLAKAIVDDSEREANKWYRRYHELKDTIEGVLTRADRAA